MRAYKVLNNSGRSDFSGSYWPLPEPGQPGEWVVAEGESRLCQNGIHATTVDQLPHWLGMELWEIELAGRDPARRGRAGRVTRRDSWPRSTPGTSRCESDLPAGAWSARARSLEGYPPGEGLANKVEHTI